MNHQYAKPNKKLSEYVRTVLIMEGFSKPAADSLPIFTNGLPALFCKTEKKKDNHENLAQLALFGKSPDDVWAVNNKTTIVAYFFKPFVVTGLFNIPAQ